MASTVLKSIKVGVKLDDGTDSQGNTKVVNLNMGSINASTFNADKALTIVDNLEPCLNKTVARVEETRVSTISGA